MFMVFFPSSTHMDIARQAKRLTGHLWASLEKLGPPRARAAAVNTRRSSEFGAEPLFSSSASVLILLRLLLLMLFASSLGLALHAGR